MESPVSVELKRIIRVAGVILLLGGLPFVLSSLCIVPMALIGNQGNEVIQFGVLSWFLALLISGTGFILYWHANRSMKNKASRPLRLPSALYYVAAFIPLLLVGAIASASNITKFLFPFVLLALATLPPLWAVVWMLPNMSAPKASAPSEGEATTEPNVPALTWRRAILSFTGGATLAFLVALILEVILPIVIVSLIFNLAHFFF